MNKIVYEYRTTVNRKGTPTLLEEKMSMFKRNYVFRSTYGYTEEVATFITSNGNTRGLKNKPIYSDVLLIDADTIEEYLAVNKKLKELGISYMDFHTGHRGGHFHIPITPMEGNKVIYSQKKWLKEVGLWELIDTSIYREGGMYRLIGAIHKKTGLAKMMMNKVDGTLLTIPMFAEPPIKTEPTVVVVGTKEAQIEYALNLMTPKTEGSRHMHFYILYKRGLEAGKTPEEIFEDIRWYNQNLCDPPHEEAELVKKFAGFR